MSSISKSEVNCPNNNSLSITNSIEDLKLGDIDRNDSFSNC